MNLILPIKAGKPLGEDIFASIKDQELSVNDQLKAISSLIDKEIYKNFKLWPANYIAFDLLKNGTRFSDLYTEKEKRQFERRLSRRVKVDDALELNSYLLMYANPVLNKIALNGE